MDGERAVQVRNSFLFEVQEVDGGGRSNGALMGGKDRTTDVLVSKAGRYRVSLREPLSGYLLPDELIVDLGAGKMTDVVIQLTRKP